VASATNLGPQLTIDRLNRRPQPAQQLDQARREADAGHPSPFGRGAGGEGLDRYRDMAYSLIGSQQIHTALDLDREPPALRESYGMTIFGQACLSGATARRGGEQVRQCLLGTSMASRVPAGHALGQLQPHEERADAGLDGALSGLIADLDQRGMLDDTLVMVLSEQAERRASIARTAAGAITGRNLYDAVRRGGIARASRGPHGSSRRDGDGAASVAEGRCWRRRITSWASIRTRS